MSRARVCEGIVLSASLLVLASGFAHGLAGWPALRGELQGRIAADVLGAVGAAWLFGSVAMAAFGAVGIASVFFMRRGVPEARWPPLIIGVAYASFGHGAILTLGAGVHFIGFLVLGLLLAGGALVWPNPVGRRGPPASPAA